MHTIKAKIPQLVHNAVIELDGKLLDSVISIKFEAGVDIATQVTIVMYAEVELEIEVEDENLKVKT